jgi:uncharacterized protein (TIGR02284 family)
LAHVLLAICCSQLGELITDDNQEHTLTYCGGFAVTETTTLTDTVETLSELVHLCRKSEESFRRAAQSVNKVELRRLFDTYAKQSARFALQLEVELVRLGGVLDRPGDLEEGLSGRARLKFPATNTTNVVDECSHIEDELVRGYQAALHAELPQPIQNVIERQITAIVAASNRLHDLRSRHRTVA